jgi:cytochrome bd-type quinol oxidase subunit 2
MILPMTVEEAAAPHSSLAFMFWGEGLFVYPLMLTYTVISYRAFRARYVRHWCTEASPAVRLKSNLGS